MQNKIEALEAPSIDSITEWLNQPRLARCGKLFVPSTPMWRPDNSNRSVNWQTAILSVPIEWQNWLVAALAYRMEDVGQGTVCGIAYVLSRGAKLGLDPLRADHVIDFRNRFLTTEYAMLVSFMDFWHNCESLEKRPERKLLDAYESIPRKKKTTKDVILSLDPEEGPFTLQEQNLLHQWLHEAFCHDELDTEMYLYLRLLMIYGQRGTQLRVSVFDDFIKTEHGYKIRLFWAKQVGEDWGFRQKYETFNLDEDLYKVVQSYKAIVLYRLKTEYPDRADWDKAIKNVPLFRRKLSRKFNRGVDKFIPVIVDTNDIDKLELAPYSEFHVPEGTAKKWLERMENMQGFPISHRTNETLKITKGHRFRYTLGTDLSNAGLDEWSMAQALMHKKTSTVRKYRQVSAELMNLVDEKLSDHLALIVNAFSGVIVLDRSFAKNGHRADRMIQDLAVCGADTTCYLDAPLSCYGCSKFQPLLEADHMSSLKRMERYRDQMIDEDKVTSAIWDRAILACRKVILDCKALLAARHKSGPAE